VVVRTLPGLRLAGLMAVTALVSGACGATSQPTASTAGSGASQPAAPSATQPAAPSATQPAAPSATPTTQPITIGVVVPTYQNPYWISFRDGAEAEGAARNVKVVVQAATDEGSIEEQTTMLQAMVGLGYDCYIGAPLGPTNLVAPFATIAKKGTPIVVSDGPWDYTAAAAANVPIVTYIASNNTKAGQLDGQEMVRLLGGKGTVAIVAGTSGVIGGEQRDKGFSDAATAGGLQVVQTVAADWDRAKALAAVGTILTAHPDLNGIFAANDAMGLGAEQAVVNASKNIKVLSIDGNSDALASIQSGKLAGTVSQYPYAEAGMTVDACLAALQGATVPKTGDSPIQLVTSANVAAAITAFPKTPTTYDNPYAAVLH
jgi:ribose transport system substrate-binding protein